MALQNPEFPLHLKLSQNITSNSQINPSYRGMTKNLYTRMDIGIIVMIILNHACPNDNPLTFFSLVSSLNPPLTWLKSSIYWSKLSFIRINKEKNSKLAENSMILRITDFYFSFFSIDTKFKFGSKPNPNTIIVFF